MRIELVREDVSPPMSYAAETPLTIGRSPEAEITLDGHTTQIISGKHATIESKGGVLHLRDLESTNGTFLNGARVTETSTLKLGDVIVLGHEGIRLRLAKIAEESRSKARPRAADTFEKAAASVWQPAPNAVIDSGIPADRHRVIPAPSPVPKPAARQPSETRQLLIKTVRRHRVTVIALSSGVILAAIVAITAWRGRGAQPSVIYRRTLPSSLLIITPEGSSGSGFIIDSSRRLAITNAHVVGSSQFVSVYQPKWNDEGRLITSLERYTDPALRATVVASDPRRDLALIELPAEAELAALTLAARPPEPGDAVFTVANPGAYRRESLWVFGTGAVNAVVEDHQYQMDDGSVVVADVVIMEMGVVSAGASGGAVVNEHGEVVAINQGGVFWEISNQLPIAVDKKIGIAVNEIREFVNAHLDVD